MRFASISSTRWGPFAAVGIAMMACIATLGTTVAAAAPKQNEATPQIIPLRFESHIADMSDEDLATQALATLNDPRGWSQAGFSYTNDPDSEYRVILAEPDEVDALCAPLGTGGRVSCQNSNVVALNANRWRSATPDWDQGLDDYRHYLYNHEVGHLSGQFHPVGRCPIPGEPEAVMAQQTKGLEGCTGNPWPLDWEIERAKERPLMLAPGPNDEPKERAVNPGGGVPATLQTQDPSAAPTTQAEPAPPATEVAPDGPATPATDEAPAPKTAPVTSATPAPNEQASPTPAQDDLRISEGSGGTPWLAILAALIGVLCLGAVLFTLMSRKRQVQRLTAANEAADPVEGDVTMRTGAISPVRTGPLDGRARTPHDRWRVQVADSSLRRAGLAWHVPERWPAHDAEALGDAADLLGSSPTPDGLVEAVSTFLRARTHLVPRSGESIALTTLGEGALLGVVLGEASLVERRSAGARPARQRGVVRLRSDAADPLQVDFLVVEGGRQRSVIRISERTPAEFQPVR